MIRNKLSILTVFLFFCCTGVIAQDNFTVGYLTYSVTNEEAKEVALESYTGSVPDDLTDLVIPSTVTNSANGNTYTVTSIRAYALGYASFIASVEIPSTVKEIGSYAFEDCYNLKTVKLSKGLQYIYKMAFRECSQLTSVNLPDGLLYVGERIFYYDHALESLTLPATLENVSDYAFAECGIKSLTLPEGLTTLSNYAFAWNSTLTSITIPSTVTNIPRSCFMGCQSVTSLTISEGVQTIQSSAFQGINADTITIPSTVTLIDYSAFQSVPAKRVIMLMSNPINYTGPFDYSAYQSAIFVVPDGTLSAWQATSWSEFKYMKEASQPDPVFFTVNEVRYAGIDATTCKVIVNEDGYYEFTNTDIIIPANVIDPNTGKSYKVVAVDDEAFMQSNAVNVVLPDCIEKIGDRAFSMGWGGGTIQSINIPSSIKYIGQMAYMGLPLTEVNLPDSVETVGRGAFAACEQLTKVTLPNSLVDKFVDDGYGYMEQITGLMPRAFSMCPNLIDVTSNIINPGVSEAFGDINPEAVLTVPDGTIDKYVDVATFDGWASFKVIRDHSGHTANRFNIQVSNWYGSVTMNGEDASTFATFAKAGKEYTFVIKPDESYIIGSILLNGTDIKSQLVHDSLLTVTLDGSAQTLTITFVKELTLKAGCTMFFNYTAFDLTSYGDDVKAWIVKSYDAATRSVNVERVYKVPASTGVILETSESRSILINEISDQEADDVSNNMLQYSYSPEWIVPKSGTGYIYVDGVYTAVYGFNFAMVGSGTSLSGFHFIPVSGESGVNGAYLFVPYSLINGAAPNMITISNGAPDAINSVKAKVGEDTIYDLFGRRVTQPSRGIYIINGKKVMVK